MSIIMLATTVLILAVLYWQASNAAKPNKNIILGVMIPPLELKNDEVLEVSNGFKKEMKMLLILWLVAFIPLMFLKYIGLLMGWFVWFGIVYYIYYKIICKYNNKLKEVKQKNNWLLPNKHILNIDTKLIKEKNKMPISKWWFLLAIVLSSIPFIIEIITNNELFSTAAICGGTSLAGTITLFIIYMTYVKGRTVVYCDESEINIACNRIYKRTWSIIYVLLAIVQSAINTIIYIFMLLPKASEWMLLIAIIMPVLLMIIGMMIENKKILETQNKLISLAKNPIYVDSDEYWINGLFYKNPYDTRVVVEPRIGTKSVYNLATKKGKIITYGSSIFAVITVAIVLLMLLSFEFYGFNININNEIVQINAPMYGIDFKVDDVVEVKLVDNIKVKMRTNGIGMDEYSVGNFTVEDYGKCKLYIYNDSKPYILIKLNKEIIFVNGDNEKETLSYYDNLTRVINENK